MNRKGFDFDPRNFHLGVSKFPVVKILLSILGYLAMTLTLAIIVYGLFALFFSTDTERELKREIRMYEKLYPELMEPREDLIRDGIANLQHKDNEIYREAFGSNAPAADPMASLDNLFSSDTVSVLRLPAYTRDKSDSLLAKAEDVDAAFERIFRALADTAFVMPPMALPVEIASYSQVGATVGRKMDPSYKAYVYHEGLDFIVVRGTDVVASADGVVSSVTNSKSTGRTIEITHPGGYVTVYAHLESTSVRVGRQVKVGDKIGTVGMSGKAFAPHLHYEIRRNGTLLDPVNYLFASVSPEEYANILYMGVNTMQSMD